MWEAAFLRSPKGEDTMNNTRMAYRQMLAGYPDVMDVEQMSTALGVSVKTGYKLLKTGEVKGLKVGRAYKIPKVRLIEYLLQEPSCATQKSADTD